MQSKVTKEEIIRIKSGETKTFLMVNYKACLSARAYACLLGKEYPRKDVKRYRCTINRAENIVTITAIKKDEFNY